MSYSSKRNVEIENELSLELDIDLSTLRIILGHWFGSLKDYEKGMSLGENVERRGFWFIGIGQLCESYREFHEMGKGGRIEDVIS